MSRHASAWRLFVLPVTRHHSLKSPVCSMSLAHWSLGKWKNLSESAKSSAKRLKTWLHNVMPYMKRSRLACAHYRDVRGLQSLRTFDHIELHLRAFLQRAGLNRTGVDEHILA